MNFRLGQRDSLDVVMEQSDRMPISGDAADRFAAQSGLALVENTYSTTPRRQAVWASLEERALRGTLVSASEAERHGTVGAVALDGAGHPAAVALDAAGHPAAATSSGGFNNKPAGRVGDSPVTGAGTHAEDGSATTGRGGLPRTTNVMSWRPGRNHWPRACPVDRQGAQTRPIRRQKAA